MTFTHIDMLFLLWTIPLLLLVYAYGWRRRKRIMARFGDPGTLQTIVPRGMGRRRRLQAGLTVTAALLLVLAMAGPQYGFRWQTVERRGVDLIVALDCSRSMLAQDIQPTRLDRAKREIIDLLAMLGGDRVGLVAFGGTAFLQCPLTLDYAAFDLFLDVLTPDYLPVGGTDLAAAIQAALDGFDPQDPADKAVILITDGEHTGRTDPEAAALAAQKAGIKLFCIGVGAGSGVPVPAAKGGFQKDPAGSIVMSRLDEALLSRLALATGGAYVRSVAGDMDLDRIYRDQIRGTMANAALESGRKQVWADRFQWPLSLALILLLAAWAIPEARTGAAALCAALIVLGAAPGPAAAGPLQKGYDAYRQGQFDQALEQFLRGQVHRPDDPRVLYNIGNAYYKTGDYDAAEAYYNRALSQAPPELQAKLRYNLGNTAYRRQALEESVAHYQAALAIDPNDEQARANLDFVREQMKQQPPPKSDGGEGAEKKQEKPATSAAQGGTPPPEKKTGSDGKTAHGNPLSDDPAQQKDGSQHGSQTAEAGEGSPPADVQSFPGNSTASEGQTQQPGAPATLQMLNRLKDEPGRAMMPRYQPRQVEKDW